MQPLTDYSGYTVAQLAGMLSPGDPTELHARAEQWETLGHFLAEFAHQLRDETVDFQEHWQGTAAAEYRRMLDLLAGHVETAGVQCLAARDEVYACAEELERAQRDMPGAVVVPPLTPEASALRSGLLPPGTDTQFLGELEQELRQVREAEERSAIAQRDAVQIMTELSAAYVDSSNRMTITSPMAASSTQGMGSAPVPTEPVGGVPPTDTSGSGGGQVLPVVPSQPVVTAPVPAPTTGVTPAPGLVPVVGTVPTPGTATVPGTSAPPVGGSGPATPANPATSPFYTAGALAAKAAMDDFGTAWQPMDSSGVEVGTDSSDGETASNPTGGGLGGGSAGGGGGGAIAGGEDTGGVGAAGARTPTAAGAGGMVPMGGASAGVAGTGMGMAGMPMMPFMPFMGGMGMGGEMGGGMRQRLPQHLVETDHETWAPMTIATAPVIGDDQPPAPQAPTRNRIT